MNISLRKAAFGFFALTASAFMANAQTPTLTEMWRTHAGFGSAANNVRGGNAVNGKFYTVDVNYITTVENGKVDTVYVSDKAMNKGLFVDQAGNMLVNRNWPTGATNWNQYTLISADGSTVKELTLEVPDGSLFVGNRADMCGRVVGDFFSEQGGICYLTANGAANALPILIKNGELVVPEYTSEAISETASNTMGSAVPAFSSMDEMDEDMYFTQYYHNSTAIQSWNIRGFNEDGEAYTVPAPELNEDGAVVVDGIEMFPTSQNGFDVVNLGGKNYYFRAYTAYKGQHWGPDFLVNDEEGNVVAYTNMYDLEAGWGTYNKTGNGGGLYVEKISETAANVYKLFANGTTDGVCVMYKFSVAGEQPELPVLYAAGSFQGWDPANPVEFTATPEGYTLAVESDSNVNFKLSTAKGDWDTFNSQLLGIAGGILEPNVLTDLVAGQDGDNTLPAGKYTITVSTDLKTIIANGEEYFTAPELYLRGSFNGWGYDDASKFASDYTLNENGEVIYTLALDELEGEVKIADANWGISLGKAENDIEGEGTYVLGRQSGAGNINVAKMTNVKLTLTYPKSVSKEATLKVECDQFVARKAFAYNLHTELDETGATILKFKVSADAPSAYIYLMDAEGNLVSQSTILSLPKGSEHAVGIPAELPNGNYTWGVEVTNNAEKTGYAYRAPIDWVDSDNTITGGVVSIRDNKEAAFGYTVVGMGKAHGYAVYDPEGNLLTETPVHKGYSKLNSGNGSSTTRGDALKGYAVFADWSDKASGAWLVDPLNIATEPRNIFMVEGATQEADGTVIYNGVETGSGSSTVAFQGEGEATKMFMFDEDIYGNCLVRYDLGDATSVMEAPTLILEGYKGKMLNTNIEVEAVENGFFVSQNRANSNDGGVPALMYFDNDGAMVWDAGAKGIFTDDPTNDNTGISSGVAVNRAGDRIAVSGYGKIYLFDLSYNEYDEPELTNRVEFDTKVLYSGNRYWCQLTFDAADNLHVFDRMGGGYAVIVPAGESTSTVKAPAELVIDNTVGVEDINIDAQSEVEYFNLQGISVKAENLTPGVYVRRQGGVATKVIIK